MTIIERLLAVAANLRAIERYQKPAFAEKKARESLDEILIVVAALRAAAESRAKTAGRAR